MLRRRDPRGDRVRGRAEGSSYAGMNRIKFAGLHLSTLGVHPGAGVIVARAARLRALGLESTLLRGADGVEPVAEMV
jgi:hypothetical protein